MHVTNVITTMNVIKSKKSGIKADPNFTVNWRSTEHPETTALIYCIMKNKKKAAKILLKNDADPNLRLSDGTTALYYAVKKRDEYYIDLLLKHGADPFYVLNILDKKSIEILSKHIHHVNQLSSIYDTLLQQRAAYPSLMKMNEGDRYFLSKMSKKSQTTLMPELKNKLDPSIKSSGFSVDLTRKFLEYLV